MTPELRTELEQALRSNDGQLGMVFKLLECGSPTNSELVEGGAAANPGAAAHLRTSVRAILDGTLPTAPTIATKTRSSIGGLLRDYDEMSSETRAYLENLRGKLETIATDGVAIKQEDLGLELASRNLEKSLEKLPGVYVYTLPSFYRTVQKSDPERFWLKIGKTDRVAGVRVGEQMRATGLPEDPWIARVYRHGVKSTKEIETEFHKLLEAAGHNRATGKHSGRDWYATNLEFLDAIARVLGCTTATNEPPTSL